MSACLSASDKEALGGGMGEELLEMGGESEMGS